MTAFKRFVLALTLVTCIGARGQQFPHANPNPPELPSEPQTLEGQLIFHDGIRRWFELKLDQSRFGQASIQLVGSGSGGYGPLQVLRGCRVRSTGIVGFSPTGYYSLDLFQSVERIEPVDPCQQQPPLPKDPEAQPDDRIQKYRVDMYVNYEPGDHPVIFRVSSGGKELPPWQAYARYSLTGGFVLYGYCGKGFVVDRVFGTAEASPQHFEEPRTPEDAAMFDPEGAADAGKRDLRLGYTCLRKP